MVWNITPYLFSGNYDKATEVLCHIEKLVPGMLQIVYRRINLERRRGNLDKASELYEHYVTNSKNKTIVVNTAIKYARFCWKVENDIDKAIGILKKALEAEPVSLLVIAVPQINWFHDLLKFMCILKYLF